MFVFLMMDINRDGLITPDDLTIFLGAKRDCEVNEVLMKDLHLIIKYIHNSRMAGISVLDEAKNVSTFKD